MSRFFHPSSFWNKPLLADAPLVNDGNNYAQKLATQAQYAQPTGYYPAGWGTICQDYAYSVPIWQVPDGTPEVKVTWMTNNGAGPAATETQTNCLQQFFDRVPIPVDPPRLQAYGSNHTEGDGHCAIWRPSTDEMWEFWVFQGPPYTCQYGAYLPNVSQHPGVLPYTWGARATSLPLVGGVMLMQEYLDGGFPHMIACSLPDVTANALSPATRTDGPSAHNPTGSTANQVPEGAIFRLPATYTPPAGATAFFTMLTEAVRDYGLIVVDATGGTVNFYLEDHHTAGSGYCIAGALEAAAYPHTFWDNVGANATGATNPLNHFPWSQLQQVAYPIS